ncbi:hypothetical protein [Microvirga sp. BSC39]|uniref:hypothetical protein n=1 Tax=Microvirga sp. BSC39 TaxID=1549810 RepID=UPI00068F43F6|nr:hypothetical protein [Microvirga sp. BSC39]
MGSTVPAEILDLMELGQEAVLVIHVGGTYGDRQDSAARWVDTWKVLPEPVRRRLVLEHDEIRFSAADVLWIHEHTGWRSSPMEVLSLHILQPDRLKSCLRMTI